MADNQKTAEAVKREVDELKKQIEMLKEQAREQGQAFSSLDEEQLTKKVRGETSKSPSALSTRSPRSCIAFRCAPRANRTTSAPALASRAPM